MAYPGYASLASPLTQDQLYKFLVYMGDPDFIGEREFAYILGTFPACVSPKIKKAKGRKKTDKGYIMPVESLDVYLGYVPRRPGPLTDKETKLFKGFVERFCVINRDVSCYGLDLYNEFNEFLEDEIEDYTDTTLEFYAKFIKYLRTTYPNKAFSIVKGFIYGVGFSRKKGSIRYCELVSKIIEDTRNFREYLYDREFYSNYFSYTNDEMHIHLGYEDGWMDDAKEELKPIPYEKIKEERERKKEEEKKKRKEKTSKKKYTSNKYSSGYRSKNKLERPPEPKIGKIRNEIDPGPLFTFLFDYVSFRGEDIIHFHKICNTKVLIDFRFKNEVQSLKSVAIETNDSFKVDDVNSYRYKFIRSFTEDQMDKAKTVLGLYLACCITNIGTKHQSVLRKLAIVRDSGISITVRNKSTDLFFLSKQIEVNGKTVEIGFGIDVANLNNIYISNSLKKVYLTAHSKIDPDPLFFNNCIVFPPKRVLVNMYCDTPIEDEYVDYVAEEIGNLAKRISNIYDT